MFSKFKFKKGIAVVLSSLTLIGGVFNTNIQGVNAQEQFTTFEDASYFNDAFGDLDGYALSQFNYDAYQQHYQADYDDEGHNYFALPLYYDITFVYDDFSLYYSNDLFNFYLNDFDGMERVITLTLSNYSGSQEDFYFARLLSSSMAIYIKNEPKLSLTGGIILTIVSVVSGLLGGLGKGIGVLFIDLFTNGTGGLSSVAIWVIVLLGVSIALGAIAWVATLIRGKQR